MRDCQLCSIDNTNTFLAAISSDYSQAWRNFGILWAYVIFNIIAALALYWLVRMPKPKKEKDDKKEKKEERAKKPRKADKPKKKEKPSCWSTKMAGGTSSTYPLQSKSRCVC